MKKKRKRLIVATICIVAALIIVFFLIGFLGRMRRAPRSAPPQFDYGDGQNVVPPNQPPRLPIAENDKIT